MVESRYLDYEKKTKKVMESFTLGATMNGWRAHGSCSLILEDTTGTFAASRFWAQSRVSESGTSVRQSYVPPLPLLLWGSLFCQVCPVCPPALSPPYPGGSRVMGTDSGIRCGSQAQLAGGVFHPTQNDVKCSTLVTFASATFSGVNKQGWQVFLRPAHVPGTPKSCSA